MAWHRVFSILETVIQSLKTIGSAKAKHKIAKKKATKNVNIKTAKGLVVINRCERTWASPPPMFLP